MRYYNKSIDECLNYLKTNSNTGLKDEDVAMRSIAYTCIIPVQDYLGLGDEARMNEPSTVGSNWSWRMKKDSFDKVTIERIKTLTKLYSRAPKQK